MSIGSSSSSSSSSKAAAALATQAPVLAMGVVAVFAYGVM